MPRLTLPYRCPMCRCPAPDASLHTHPQLGVLCDDCYALIEDTDSLVLVPRLPLISNFTDLGLSPHADSVESPS